jgi:hypothetical protein
MLFLATIENNQRINNQDFWSVYFTDPLGENNNFIIDNKTQKDAVFDYEISIEDEVKDSGNIKIPKDTHKLIETKELNNQPVLIVITTNDTKKEIEKK